MYSSLFWKDVFERVVSTMAQTLLGYLVAAGFTPLTAHWLPILVTVVTAGVVCVLKAIVAASATSNTTTVSPASFATDARGSGVA